MTNPSLLQSLTYSHSVGEIRFQPGTSKAVDEEFESVILTAPAEAKTKAATGNIALKKTFFIIIKFWLLLVIYSLIQVFDRTPETGRLIVITFDNTF